MIYKPDPFKGLNIRLLIRVLIKERVFFNHGSTVVPMQQIECGNANIPLGLSTYGGLCAQAHGEDAQVQQFVCGKFPKVRVLFG